MLGDRLPSLLFLLVLFLYLVIERVRELEMILPVSMGTQPLPGSGYNNGAVIHTLPMSVGLQTKHNNVHKRFRVNARSWAARALRNLVRYCSSSVADTRYILYY